MSFQFEGNGEFESGGKQGLLADINVTPLVDVMLVLLIILMVAAPFAVSGVSVQLPSSKAKSMSLGASPIILSVTHAGAYYLGRSRIASNDLLDKLKAARGSEKDPAIYIRADRSVPYGKIMEAMSAAQQAGIHRIGMLGEGQSTQRKVE
jgi:biopolymer transport protein ExbD